MTEVFIEIQFSANDLDSGDSITDVLLFKEGLSDERIEEILNNKLKKHSIIELTGGNTWELDGFVPTGRKLEVTRDENRKPINFLEIEPREPDFADIEYPEMNIV